MLHSLHRVLPRLHYTARSTPRLLRHCLVHPPCHDVVLSFSTPAVTCVRTWSATCTAFVSYVCSRRTCAPHGFTRSLRRSYVCCLHVRFTFADLPFIVCLLYTWIHVFGLLLPFPTRVSRYARFHYHTSHAPALTTYAHDSLPHVRSPHAFHAHCRFTHVPVPRLHYAHRTIPFVHFLPTPRLPTHVWIAVTVTHLDTRYHSSLGCSRLLPRLGWSGCLRHCLAFPSYVYGWCVRLPLITLSRCCPLPHSTFTYDHFTFVALRSLQDSVVTI